MGAYERLGPYADARPALERLKAAGLRLAILSNGAPRMLGAAAGNAKLADLLETIVSIEEVGIYKPHPRSTGSPPSCWGSGPARSSSSRPTAGTRTAPRPSASASPGATDRAQPRRAAPSAPDVENQLALRAAGAARAEVTARSPPLTNGSLPRARWRGSGPTPGRVRGRLLPLLLNLLLQLLQLGGGLHLALLLRLGGLLAGQVRHAGGVAGGDELARAARGRRPSPSRRPPAR